MADTRDKVSTSVPESDKVKFNNVLKCNVLGYIGPKNKDDECYQLCHIDDSGKMQGASTPFQFLEQSAEVQHYAINIKMMEKEMASTGSDGSQAAQQIDTEEKIKQFKQVLDRDQLCVQKSADDNKKLLTQTISSSTDSSTSLDVAENLPITESGEGNRTLEVVSNSQGSQGASEQLYQGVQATSSKASQGSTKMEGALQRPASSDDTIGPSEQTFSIKHAFKEMKEDVDTLECNYQAAKTENESLKRNLEEEREKAQREIKQRRDDQAFLLRKIRALNDDLKETEQRAQQERETAQHQTKTAQQEIERAQQEIDERREAQTLLEGQITNLVDQINQNEQREREREEAWQLESLCYQHEITELFDQHESLMAYHRLEVYEDRTTGRPPRCIENTAKHRPCLRSAREFPRHKRLCLQHYRKRYGDPQ